MFGGGHSHSGGSGGAHSHGGSGGSIGDPIGCAVIFVISCIVIAILTGIGNFGKYLFELTHGGYGAPIAGSWGSMYLNMGWGIIWGILALGLFLESTLKRNIRIFAAGSAVLAIIFGGIGATHFAHKVGISSPWWGANAAAFENHQSLKASAPNGRRASHRPTRAIPSAQARLVCDVPQTSAYANDGNDCTTHHIYTGGDAIVLEVSGFTPTIVKYLCRRKYHDEWTTSRDPYGYTWLVSRMCPVPIDGFGSDNELMASFKNPGKLGPDVVTWRLIGPSGRTVRTARYKFRVLETDSQPLATPPS